MCLEGVSGLAAMPYAGPRDVLPVGRAAPTFLHYPVYATARRAARSTYHILPLGTFGALKRLGRGPRLCAVATASSCRQSVFFSGSGYARGSWFSQRPLRSRTHRFVPSGSLLRQALPRPFAEDSIHCCRAKAVVLSTLSVCLLWRSL